MARAAVTQPPGRGPVPGWRCAGARRGPGPGRRCAAGCVWSPRWPEWMQAAEDTRRTLARSHPRLRGERGLAGTGRARPAGAPLTDCGSAWAAGASWQEPRGPECFQDAGTSWCLSKLVGAVKFLYANNGLCMLNVLKNIWTVSKKMV